MVEIDEIDRTVQQINLSDVQITIPADKVIISKREYKELREAVDNQPVLWSLKQARDYMGLSRDNFLKIIYDPDIKKELDVDHGGCVMYWSQGSQYYFLRDEFKKYVDAHGEKMLRVLCH